MTRMNHGKTVLESKRMSFHQMLQEDFAEIKAMMSDPKVMYAWEHTFTDQQINDWISSQQNRYLLDGVGYLTVRSKSNGEVLGQMGLHHFSWENEERCEVCYMLNSNHFKQGYALEGVRALTEYAFKTLHLDIVYAQIKTNNYASIAVAERAGFTKHSTFIKHYNGIDMEHFLYLLRNKK